VTGRNTDLEFGHEGLHCSKKVSSIAVRQFLLIELGLDCWEKGIELLGFDHWPGNNVQLTRVEP